MKMKMVLLVSAFAVSIGLELKTNAEPTFPDTIQCHCVLEQYDNPLEFTGCRYSCTCDGANPNIEDSCWGPPLTKNCDTLPSDLDQTCDVDELGGLYCGNLCKSPRGNSVGSQTMGEALGGRHGKIEILKEIYSGNTENQL